MPAHGVEIRRRLPFPRDVVWEAWADPAQLAGWFVDEADARIDRQSQVTWTWSAFGLRSIYDVVEARSPDAFELRSAAPEGEGHSVRVELHEGDAGGTELLLSQWDFPDADRAAAGRSGWEIALALLDLYLARYRGATRRSFLLMAPVEATREAVRALYRTRSGLASWLGASDGLPAEGESFVIRLDADGDLSGRVLRATEYETAVTWEEIDGALELKVFPGPEELIAALRVSSWSGRDPEQELAILEAAFDRLLERARQPA